ncbi:MAG: SPOR domain-containing protein [Gallionella sp.]|nr:SPOR domain-containing protein [Gallionella sp.]MDD4958593.1 SPOR domain-containing protein [Gallionella sp.]
MIKVLLWIMLVANVVFFAVMQWGAVLFTTPELEQAEPELNPQKIALQSELPPPVSTSSVMTASGISSTAEVIAASAITPAMSSVSTTNHLACMEWGEFSADDLTLAQKELAELHPAFTLRTIQYGSEYWVYIPPTKNKNKLSQRVAELDAAGITDYAVVSAAGEWEHAISLGTFNSKQEAQKFAASIRKISPLKIGEYRPAYQTTMLRLNDLDGATLAKLTELQKHYPKTSLNNLDCSTHSGTNLPIER